LSIHEVIPEMPMKMYLETDHWVEKGFVPRHDDSPKKPPKEPSINLFELAILFLRRSLETERSAKG